MPFSWIVSALALICFALEVLFGSIAENMDGDYD